MKKMLFALIVSVLLAACSSAVPATSTPVPEPTEIPPTAYQVTLFCQDCADIGMAINLWTDPDRSGVAGSVPHNTVVTVLDSRMVDGTQYYYVRYVNTRGWVSELMVKR